MRRSKTRVSNDSATCRWRGSIHDYCRTSLCRATTASRSGHSGICCADIARAARARACARTTLFSLPPSLSLDACVYEARAPLASCVGCVLESRDVEIATRRRLFCMWNATFCDVSRIARVLTPNSLALKMYLDRVYGDAQCNHIAMQRSWHWETVEFIWLQYLPANIFAECSFAGIAHGPGSLFHSPHSTSNAWAINGALWANGALSAGEPHDWGGPRHPPRILSSRWVEVTHRSFPRGGQLERQALWLYHANGSGLWYRTGPTFSVSDVADLGIWLRTADNNSYSWRKSDVLEKATRLLRLRGYETIEFRFHVDMMEPTAYKHELLGLRAPYPLRPGQVETCPPDMTMRRGWGGREESCVCEASRKHCLERVCGAGGGAGRSGSLATA